MRLTPPQLNRTLLSRQGLLERRPGSVSEVCTHLVGLQAQDNLPPFLSLAARLDDLDPHEVTRGLEAGTLVRLVTLRSTIHLLTAADAVTLRRWTTPAQERELRSSAPLRPARDVDRQAIAEATRAALADGPLPVRRLGDLLAERFPDIPSGALVQLARVTQPLAQVPPRGAWKGSGGVVYEYVDALTGLPMADPDPRELVRRYLRAFGPASAADVTTWSGVPGIAAILKQMPDLVEHTDAGGRRLFDVPEGTVVDPDVPAPVRLLGAYDNVWLSHSGRDRVTELPDKRQRWMGANGGVAQAVFVDGWLEGLWRIVDGRPEVLTLFRRLTRSERSELDDELARVAALLTR